LATEAGGAVRIARVGTGRWASALALEIAQTDGAELVGCCDLDRERARRFATEFGVNLFDDLDSVAAEPGVDAGVACVPNAAHREVACALAAAGKHVFVPRPVANLVRRAKDIIEAAKGANVVLFVDHSSSFSPDMDAMYEAAQSGATGKLFGGHAFRSANWERTEGVPDWHFSPRQCPGGPATLLGVPAAATLIRFLGDPVGVRGSVAAGLVQSRVPNVTTFLIEHESGAHSTLVSSGVSAVPNDHYYFYGMSGVIMYGPTTSRAGPRAILAEGGSRILRELAPAGPARRGMRMFVDQVLEGTEPLATAALALTALATVEAGLKSVAENRRVTVSEVLAG
jgi:predicted dehydrogenase